MKRQRSRGRGGGGGGGGGKPTHNANRAFDSNGPDSVKIRGHAQHVFEKYQQLARDAASSGDRVLAENYLQHAEHYFRVLRAVQPQRPASEIIGRDAFASGIDIDFEDENPPEAEAEGQEGAGAEEGGEPRQDQRQDGRQEYRSDRGDRGDYNRDRRPEYRRDEYNRDRDRTEGGRSEGARQDGGRQDGGRSEGGRQESGRQESGRQEGARPEGQRPEGQRPEGQRAEGRPDRYEGRRDERGGSYRRDERGGGYRDERRDRYEPRGERGGYQDRGEQPSGADPLPVVEPEATPLTAAREEDRSSMLRSQDGGVSAAPAFLQSRVEVPSDSAEDAPAAPRRRRSTRAPREAAPSTAEES